VPIVKRSTRSTAQIKDVTAEKKNVNLERLAILSWTARTCSQVDVITEDADVNREYATKKKSLAEMTVLMNLAITVQSLPTHLV